MVATNKEGTVLGAHNIRIETNRKCVFWRKRVREIQDTNTNAPS